MVHEQFDVHCVDSSISDTPYNDHLSLLLDWTLIIDVEFLLLMLLHWSFTFKDLLNIVRWYKLLTWWMEVLTDFITILHFPKMCGNDSLLLSLLPTISMENVSKDQCRKFWEFLYFVILLFGFCHCRKHVLFVFSGYRSWLESINKSTSIGANWAIPASYLLGSLLNKDDTFE